jgi:hypothetical protein
MLPAVVSGLITDCDPSSVFRPLTLELTPDPPIRGQSITMIVQFNNPSSVISDGTVVTSVTLNGIPFTPSTDPLCETTICPIDSGFNDRSAKSTWPDISGKVVSKSQWYNADGKSLLCVKTSVTVSGTSKPMLRTYPYVEWSGIEFANNSVIAAPWYD